jgi:hypothetical protein
MDQPTLTKREMVMKFLKLAGISGAVFIVGSLIVLFTLALIFQERIKGIFLESINKSLATEIMVDDIRLDLIRHFPSASLTFSNTLIMEPGTDPGRDTLAQARRLYLKFSLWDLMRRNYTIRELELSRASVKAVIQPDGTPNFLFWETTAPDEPAGDFSIALKRITLNQVVFQFDDRQTNTRINLDLDRAVMSGQFNNESFDLQAKGNLLARELTFDGTVFLLEKPMEVDVSLLVNDMQEYIFQKGVIRVNDHAFSLLGSISTGGEGSRFDTQVSGRDLNLHSLLDDLPEVWKKYTEGYRSKGRLVFNANIQGVYSARENPYIEADFSISNGELHHRPTGLKLTELGFTGSFNNGRQRNLGSSSLEVKGFHTRINQGLLRGDFSMVNFQRPNLDLNLFADANVGDLVKLIRLDQVDAASGHLTADLTFRGRMSQKNRFTIHDMGQARASGNIKIANAAFRIKGNPLDYRDFNGAFMFNNTDLVVEEFSGKVSSSDFTMKGHFRNVLPYLFLENEKINIDVNLYAQNLNFDELFQQNMHESDTTYQLRFSDRIGFNLEASVVNLNFRRFRAEHVMGNASLQNKRFQATNLALRSMDGHIRANGFIDGTRDDYMVFGCDAHLRGVDIHQLFYQMGNFGQTEIVDENIFGTITSNLRFTARWSPSLDVDWGSLETTADIKVENGALVNYQPMIELSRFLRVDDLDRVTFSTLENQIRIKDRKIIIPEMEIKSSALNLKLTGEHSFNNEIDYRMQVLLSDLLARKNRQARNPQEQYGDIIDDGLGRTTLFLALTGTTSAPVFRYDYRGVREKLQEDLRQERQNLREVLRSEFGLPSRQTGDTTRPLTPAQQRREHIRKQEEGEFVIEWEENKP